MLIDTLGGPDKLGVATLIMDGLAYAHTAIAIAIAWRPSCHASKLVGRNALTGRRHTWWRATRSIRPAAAPTQRLQCTPASVKAHTPHWPFACARTRALGP